MVPHSDLAQLHVRQGLVLTLAHAAVAADAAAAASVQGVVGTESAQGGEEFAEGRQCVVVAGDGIIVVDVVKVEGKGDCVDYGLEAFCGQLQQERMLRYILSSHCSQYTKSLRSVADCPEHVLEDRLTHPTKKRRNNNSTHIYFHSLSSVATPSPSYFKTWKLGVADKCN